MDEVKRKGSKMASREQKFSTQCPCGPLHSTMWNTQCTKSSTNTSVKHKVHKIINKHLCETHSAKKIINNGEKNEFPSQLMTNPPPLEIQLGKETKESWLRKTSVWWKAPTTINYNPNQPTITTTNNHNQPTPATLHRPEWGSWWRSRHQPQTPASTPTRSLTPANTSSVPREIHFCWSWCQPVTAGFCEICSQEMERGKEKVVTRINFDI